MKLKVMEVMKYGGHSLSANGTVSVTFSAMYSELAKSLQLMQLLNEDVTVAAKLPGEKPMPLGVFRVHQLIVDSDGESKVKLRGMSEFVETDSLNSLPLRNSEVPEFQVLFKADVESVEGDGGDGE